MHFTKVEVLSFQKPEEKNLVTINADHIVNIVPNVKVQTKVYDYLIFMDNGQQFATTGAEGNKLIEYLFTL